MYFRRKTSAGRAYLQIVESRREGTGRPNDQGFDAEPESRRRSWRARLRLQHCQCHHADRILLAEQKVGQ
jgi:hypothetical protein